MLKFIFLCLFFSLVLSNHYPFTETNHIILIGDPNWHYAVDEYTNSNLLVYYYEPYCLPCREFWPELQKTAQDLFAAHSIVQIARIDCHDEVVLCDKHGVKHFPTILLHPKNSGTIEYTGALDSGSLYNWARKYVDSVYQVIDAKETLFSRHSAAILVNKPSNAINLIYREFADEIEIAEPGANLKKKVGTTQSVVLTQGGEIIYIQDTDTPAIIRDKINDMFYKYKQAIPTFSLKTSNKMQMDGDQSFVFFFKTNKVTLAAVESFNKVAKNFKSGSLIFYYVNIAGSRLGKTIADLFGVDEGHDPYVGVMARRSKVYSKYKMQDYSMTVDAISAFLSNFERGALQPYYMSAEIPEDVGYVKELVGRNYDEITRDERLNVFVMLYFPWCEECVKVEPTWTSLAYRVRNHNIVIARMDISKNDLEGLNFTEYPVFLFYPEGQKKIVQYLEDRKMSYFQDFLSGYVKGLKEDIEL